MTKSEFDFEKNSKGQWYMVLPEWQGDPADLQLVEGADRWMELMSGAGTKIRLRLSDQPFPNAEMLTLIHLREQNLGGGGNYFLESYQGKNVHLKLWLCEVTRFIFNSIPQRLYFLGI